MRRLDRYLLLEVISPTALGFLVYTFILLTQFLFRSAEMIIRRGLPASDVGKLLLLSLPNIIVLTIPMAFLFGILVAIGRLASDSELIAMRSCGVSLFYLYRPILVLSLVLTGLTAFVMIYLLPIGNKGVQSLYAEIFRKSAVQQVQPRVFYEEWEGLILYVFEIPPGQRRWKGVFLADDLPGVENQVTVADWGELREEGDQLVLLLGNAITHKVNFSTPDRYHTAHHEVLRRVLGDKLSARVVAFVPNKPRDLSLVELWARARAPDTAEPARRLAWVEVHKRLAIPFACLVFGLLALPLGFNNRRGGKSSSFALSIGVIMVYYVLLGNGEEAARVGKISPWLAMWLPNLLLTTAGFLLLWRKNRDKSLLLGALDRRLRQRLTALTAKLRQRREVRRRHRRLTQRAASGVVVRLPRLRLRFPNLLDRYVIRTFAWVLGLVALSALTIYTVADLTENIDDILSHKIHAGVVVDYYKYLSIQIFFETAPILVLVTTLITFALLSRHNEVVASKALGVSLYRLSLPAVAAALTVALFCGFLEGFVLPYSNERVAQIKDQIKGREAPRTYRRADRQWLFGQGRYIYNYLRYDPRDQELDRLQVFELDESYALTRRLFATKADYLGDSWVFTDAWVRSFDGSSIKSFRQFPQPVILDYPETPAYFESEVREPDQMAFRELRSYIQELRSRGQPVPELEVELQRKVAFPVVALVMSLVALPFAFRLGKRGALYGVGLGVVLGMIFLGVYAFFTTLGEAGALPPTVAVWSPSALFAIFSVYLFLGVKT